MSRLGALLVQRLRRDWLQLTLWIAGTVALALSGFAGVAEAYGTEQDRLGILAAVMANPVILLFRGLPSGPDRSAFVVFLLFPFLAMMAAFMSAFLAVRHTRGDEEAGRLELIDATPAGRWMPTVATLVHGVLANAVLGILVALSLLAGGAETEGSLLVGFAAAATGLVFLGLGMLSAQLMRTSRAANSLTVWILLSTFVLAGVGNALGTPSDDLTHMESSWLAWTSPFGWAENTRAYDENLWWPALLCIGAFLVLTAGAFALQAGRDQGAGIVAERRGRANARAGLASTTALVSRLSAPSTIGWIVGALVAGALSTALGSVVDQIGGENPAIADVLTSLAAGSDLQQSVIVVFFMMIGLLAACAAVQTVARARQEETHGTAEPVLATPTARVRWLADFLIAGVVAVALTCAGGVAGAALGAIGSDAASELIRSAAVAAAGQVVAASVFLVLTALVFTVAPRLTIPLGWTLLVVAIVIGLFGPLLGLSDEVTQTLSPFAVTPQLDGDTIDLRGLPWLLLAVVAGGAASLGLMRRRELAAAG
ncbi:ABC transporter permease [Microbacterium ulmi]|uniref:Polyketide antibiotic transporter n=1 Tax=Microbacterium ulmi TaxID=179095 RepID=A0A7Y2Q0U2_9MICO|nr:polyketide antibiotic transporter [Microbacterium ulmi]NII69088.1 ABC-2 type transport system permease protein [Microbacterium ulmi]NNH04718.1 polyketide antibiotic transporter [Microbacterium ulmi]